MRNRRSTRYRNPTASSAPEARGVNLPPDIQVRKMQPDSGVVHPALHAGTKNATRYRRRSYKSFMRLRDGIGPRSLFRWATRDNSPVRSVPRRCDTKDIARFSRYALSQPLPGSPRDDGGPPRGPCGLLQPYVCRVISAPHFRIRLSLPRRVLHYQLSPCRLTRAGEKI